MPSVQVNIFQGTEPQIPTTYQMEGNTYQDLVTVLIRNNINSGAIYGVHGEIIDYNAPIMLPEVNYIIPSGPNGSIMAKGLRGQTYYLTHFKVNGTIRDIYNCLVANGVPIGARILVSGRLYGLDEPISAIGPTNSLTNIHFLS